MNNETAPLSDERLKAIRARDAADYNDTYLATTDCFDDRRDLLRHLSYLTRRAKELEADAARLDWMVAIGGYRYTVVQIDGYYVAEIRCGFPARLTNDLYPTPRAAIDAALQLDGKEKQRGE